MEYYIKKDFFNYLNKKHEKLININEINKTFLVKNVINFENKFQAKTPQTHLHYEIKIIICKTKDHFKHNMPSF